MSGSSHTRRAKENHSKFVQVVTAATENKKQTGQNKNKTPMQSHIQVQEELGWEFT